MRKSKSGRLLRTSDFEIRFFPAVKLEVYFEFRKDLRRNPGTPFSPLSKIKFLKKLLTVIDVISVVLIERD